MFTPYTFTTPNPGKNILILGAVHGNETAGTEAQLKLIEQLRNQEVKLKSGSVTFIPIVNEAANKIDERFVDVNLNRVICHHDTPSNNEERIANALLPFIEKCDILVDLHSTKKAGQWKSGAGVEIGFQLTKCGWSDLSAHL